ncbi:S-adenosyl-L-methionine-dependent methyltransferase [Xylariomycetidae sp. FL2044]|nr:S-adenosyl-L-methionine-dependent methyltransferase [Xylariomycetidae sp. FL2044]
MSTKELSRPEYWDEAYTGIEPDQQKHEWFRTFRDLEQFFERRIFHAYAPEMHPRILHLGSGDSTIPADLWERGYKNQLCVDFSTVVLDAMAQRHRDKEGIEWKHADVRNMSDVPTASVDVAFDKGTMDAMIHGSPWSPPDDVFENTGSYIQEVLRVLKPDGKFLYVTYRQPHFIKPLFNRDKADWDIELEELGGTGSTFSYYAFTLRKAS